MERFYITTPIYYVNAVPHLGHAYTTTVADCMARFNRAMGRDAYFLTGTDEHGDKIVQAAEKSGLTPRAYVDEISGHFRALWPELSISNDDFIRTTEPRHVRVVQKLLQQIYDAGDIYFGEYGGHYCTGCERFLTEKELVDGLCPDHKTKPEYIAEKNYFFRMSKYQGWLLDHIKANPDFIRPERYRSEVVSMLEMGVLEDLCISRPKSRLTWGIELPFDTDYVCYVWFDALVNYLTAVDWPDGEKFGRYWPAVQHLVAKDILKPHAVFWPTMLKAAGIEPYKHLNVHGYWLVKETKMSKSLGNVVKPLDMSWKYGLDTFRYFLLREMRFGNDASFSEEALVARRNSDLANDLGNLFNRTLSMAGKYFGSRVPAPQDASGDEDLRGLAANAVGNFVRLFGECNFSQALESLWELVRGLNKYVDAQAPWALFKEGKTERLAEVMYGMLECMRKVAACLVPVMPQAAGQMLEQLGVMGTPGLTDEADAWGLLKPGNVLAQASTLFPRIELPAADDAAACPTSAKGEMGGKGKVAKEAEAAKPAAGPKAKADASAKAPAEAPGEIEFPDFQKLDLRVGHVTSVERHPDADRLLLVQVDLGEERPRQVVAGLAEFFTPEDLAGRQVVLVANLKPRKLRGHESQGMILAVRTEAGMELLTASGSVAPGSKVS
ncbi:Methionyl-tRNA synthetase [Desulfovibrio sp. X2]|uniref:methionine--tRNA ligase n=1 Tax=Desulfovibrio sp. X2 TaxID=941449 RepID=UPI0003589834|nr:methionine--tRNA ligase [Desulfovibrio sp. X2]EPR37465.1 Methionyl-tRNA synthetase [Desulfovibrio sp. X2]